MKRVSWNAVGLVAVLATAGCGSTTPQAAPTRVEGSITVLAAASLTESFTAIGHAFEAAHPGVRVTFSFGASSTLAAQVTQGAPADVFASAAPQPMASAREAGDLAAPARTFARNVLEIAVPPGNPGHVTGLASLSRSGLRLALCAPEVPCGAAAKTLLARDRIQVHPTTYAKDVKSVLALVKLGEVDAGLVYRTDVKASGDKVVGVEIPDATQVVNDYPIAVLAHAANPVTARAFVDYVLAPPGREVLSGDGFLLP